jgi:hypothetical protein
MCEAVTEWKWEGVLVIMPVFLFCMYEAVTEREWEGVEVTVDLGSVSIVKAVPSCGEKRCVSGTNRIRQDRSAAHQLAEGLIFLQKDFPAAPLRAVH